MFICRSGFITYHPKNRVLMLFGNSVKKVEVNGVANCNLLLECKIYYYLFC